LEGTGIRRKRERERERERDALQVMCEGGPHERLRSAKPEHHWHCSCHTNSKGGTLIVSVEETTWIRKHVKSPGIFCKYSYMNGYQAVSYQLLLQIEMKTYGNQKNLFSIFQSIS
jgi:hypothetical protein